MSTNGNLVIAEVLFIQELELQRDALIRFAAPEIVLEPTREALRKHRKALLKALLKDAETATYSFAYESAGCVFNSLITILRG